MKKETKTSTKSSSRPAAKKAAAAAGPKTAKTAARTQKAPVKKAPVKEAPTMEAPVKKPAAKEAPARKQAPAGAERFEPRIIAFVCKWCSEAQEAYASKHTSGRPAVRLVSVMCSGRVQPSLVLKAFELGADGVIVCGCGPGNCHYYFGNERQAEMFETSKKLVSLLGLEPDRLRLEWIQGADGNALGAVLDEFTEAVRRAGPSPLRK